MILEGICQRSSYLSRGCLCVEHRRSRHTRRSCRRSFQTPIHSTGTGCSCTRLVHCRSVCLQIPGRRWETCCLSHPPGIHSGHPGSRAHIGKSHSYKYLQGKGFFNFTFPSFLLRTHTRLLILNIVKVKKWGQHMYSQKLRRLHTLRRQVLFYSCFV